MLLPPAPVQRLGWRLTGHCADFSALGALTVDTPITAFLSELQQSTPKNLSDVSCCSSALCSSISCIRLATVTQAWCWLQVENIVIDIFDEFCTAATCVLVRATSPFAKVQHPPCNAAAHAQMPMQESEDDSSDKFSKSSDLSFNASLSITKSSACIGKTATLALEPWSCEFDTDSKSVTCTPAVLVLQKTPGEPR